MTLTNLTSDITDATPTPPGTLPGREGNVPAYNPDAAADVQKALHDSEGSEPTRGESIITTDAPD